ncbi:hypothetical protein DSECCO2_630790 [anaerobic digester metagenome]
MVVLARIMSEHSDIIVPMAKPLMAVSLIMTLETLAREMPQELDPGFTPSGSIGDIMQPSMMMCALVLLTSMALRLPSLTMFSPLMT